jgi:hypothetical protein
VKRSFCLLGLLISLLSQQPLRAQTQQPANLDEEFYSVLHGFNPEFEMGTDPWKEKLGSIVNRSSSKNHAGAQQEAQMIAAMEKFPPPRDMSESYTLEFLSVSRAYNKIRIESPDSTWFKTERFPQLLDDLAKKFPSTKDPKAGPSSCPPELGTAGQIAEAAAILSNTPQAATELTQAAENKIGSAPPKTDLQSRTSAVKFVESLDLSLLSPNPVVVARTAAMEEALQAGLKRGRSINQWSKHAKATRIIFHHTASGVDLDAPAVQAMHLTRGWADIGYHFLIDSNGVISVGRDLRYQGANAKGNNSDSIGVGFIGNFHPYDAKENPSGYTSAESEAPSEAQIQAAVALAQALKNPDSNIYKYATSQGLTPQITDIMGHTDCVATACPGEAGLPVVRAIKEKLLAPKAEPKTEAQPEGGTP